MPGRRQIEIGMPVGSLLTGAAAGADRLRVTALRRCPTALIVLTAGSLFFSANAFALDAAPRPQPLTPTSKYSSAREALRDGVRDYNAGDKRGAAQALEYAAGKGHTLALWKLGRMYADGDGVPHDDLRAFEYFSKLADQNADESPDSQSAAVVSSAFVALGSYFLDGIANSYVTANPARAAEMFHYAASYYSDPNAQYNLARLYMEGTGVAKDPRLAARWFNLAAEKGHHASQALLGHLLLNGLGVPRQRARGLMWLTLAHESADPVKEVWITELYDKAFSTSGEGDKKNALAMLEQYVASKN
jgi:TPR repeat protein